MGQSCSRVQRTGVAWKGVLVVGQAGPVVVLCGGCEDKADSSMALRLLLQPHAGTVVLFPEISTLQIICPNGNACSADLARVCKKQLFHESSYPGVFVPGGGFHFTHCHHHHHHRPHPHRQEGLLSELPWRSVTRTVSTSWLPIIYIRG